MSAGAAPVPRSTEATEASAVAEVELRRVALPNAWWGMAMVVASELTLFGTFFGTYFYLRFNTVHWPPPGTPKPHYVIPLIMAGILLSTSAPIQAASRFGRRGHVKLTWLALFLALVVQSGYFGYEIHDLIDQLHTLEPQRNAYASIYYVLLGADHAHVFVGLVLSLWLLLKLVRGLTTYRLNALRAITFYWHFVNVLTMGVILVLVSPRL